MQFPVVKSLSSDTSDSEGVQNLSTQAQERKLSLIPKSPNSEAIMGTADLKSISSDDENEEEYCQQYSNNIDLGEYEASEMSFSTKNGKGAGDGESEKPERRDRATVRQVWDSTTTSIVEEMMSRQPFKCEIGGCICTGKEANVYHVISKTGEEFALKIYRTSILIFANREKYITGDHRLQGGYNKRNPRKMVQTWAEKEWKNLCKLNAAGIRSPYPKMLTNNVLLMNFIGTGEQAAPQLKDVVLAPSEFRRLYRECVEIMWRLYNVAGLIHADLSEYNLLYHDGSIFVIDVSQAVGDDHPMAFEFLRMDCTNITNFFEKKGVAFMDVSQLFNFITDGTINEKNMDAFLDAAEEAANEDDEIDSDTQIEEIVLENADIPQYLNQVVDAEQDINHQTQVGSKSDLIVADTLSNNEEVNDAVEEEPVKQRRSKFVSSARPRNETAEQKKLRKRAFKVQEAEKQDSKLSKKKKNIFRKQLTEQDL